MKKTIFCILGLALCLAFTLSGCTPTPEERLERRITSFSECPSAAHRKKIARAIIAIHGKNAVPGAQYAPLGNCLTRTIEGKRIILSPSGIEAEIKPGYTLAWFDTVTGKCALSDGISLDISDLKSNNVLTFSLAIDGKTPVDGMLFSGGNVYYLSRGNLFVLDTTTDKKTPLFGNTSFSPPFRGLAYVAMLQKHGDYLALNVGNAGQYNLNLIDLKKNEVVIRNLSTATSRFNFNGKNLHYLSGASGQWMIRDYDIASKKGSVLSAVKDITDIVFFDSCALLRRQDSMSVFLYDESKEVSSLPELNYLGSGSETGVVIFEDKFHLAGPGVFDSIASVLKKFPDIASAPDRKQAQ